MRFLNSVAILILMRRCIRVAELNIKVFRQLKRVFALMDSSRHSIMELVIVQYADKTVFSIRQLKHAKLVQKIAHASWAPL